MGLSLKKPARHSPSGSNLLAPQAPPTSRKKNRAERYGQFLPSRCSRRFPLVASLLFLLAVLAGCGGTPRFAPPPDEDFTPPSRAHLQGEDTHGVTTPVGEFPLPHPPSLRCLTVGPDGKAVLPPLGPLRPAHSYADDIVCQVRLSPQGAGGVRYDRLALLIRAANGARIPMKEIPLCSGPEICEHLLWLSAQEWRPVTHNHTHLIVEAAALCQPESAPEGDETCDLHLVQSFPLKEAAPLLPEDQKRLRIAKGLSVLHATCAPYTPLGHPDAPRESYTLPLEEMRCTMTVENPSSEVVEGAIAEIRAGAYRASARRVAARALPPLLPHSRFSLQLHLPGLSGNPGPFVLVAAAGRNASERLQSEKTLSLKLLAP